MNRYRKIDVESWKRGPLFRYFQDFDGSCFNLTVKVEAQKLYDYAKANGESFFLLTLYAILRSANQVAEMRQRVIGEEVIEYEKIAVMTPVMNKETELFEQVWCEYEDTFATFKRKIEPLVELAKQGTPAKFDASGTDFICASCLPWLHFESFVQAELSFQQSAPILAWGKMSEGKIPVAIKLSHAFCDGLHVSRFFSTLEFYTTNPQELYLILSDF